MPAIKKTGQLKDLRSTDALTRYGLDLLRQERDAILSGSFEALSPLADQKIALLDEIEIRAEQVSREQTTPERETRRESLVGVATILSRRATENQNLLASARNGAQRAKEMIEQMNTGSGFAGFYSATGRKIPDNANGGTTSVKA